MIGCWKSPFGVVGLSICDIGVGFGIDLNRLNPTPAILAAFDYFRVQGGVKLGKLIFGIKLVIDVSSPMDCAFLGFLKGKLCLSDLFNVPLSMMRNVGIPVPLIPMYFVPKVCIENVIIKASMSPIVIAGENFEPGLTLAGQLTIMDKVFVLNNTLAILRVELHASASALEFGPLSLGGLGCDMKPNTPDDGVCLRAKLGIIPGPFEAYFYFTAEFSVAGFFKVMGMISLDKTGLEAHFKLKVIIAEAEFKVWTSNKGDDSDDKTKPVDFKVYFKYTNKGFKYLADQITKGLHDFEKDMDKAIQVANDEIEMAAKTAGNECRSALGVQEQAAQQQAFLQLTADEKQQLHRHHIVQSVKRIAAAAGAKHCLGKPTDEPDCVDSKRIDFARLRELVLKAEAAGYFKMGEKIFEAPKSTAESPGDAKIPREQSHVRRQSRKSTRPRRLRVPVANGAAGERKLLARVERDEVDDAVTAKHAEDVRAITDLGTTSKMHGKMHGKMKWGHRWHVHIPHRHHIHFKALEKFASNVWEGAKGIYKGVAGALCSAGEMFMDVVVKNVVKGAMMLGKTVVMVAGKVVAAGLAALGGLFDNLFAVREMTYEGSARAALRGNFGTLGVKLTLVGRKVDFVVEFDMKKLVQNLWKMVKDAVKKIGDWFTG
jgi:hypothetical protein